MSRLPVLWAALMGGCLPDFAFTEPGTSGFDFDNDGAAFPEDCDDRDPDLGPENGERCDGRHTDCATTAEEFATYEVDQDGDGFVACATWEGEPGPLQAGDCDDHDDQVFPDATEVVADGKDNDCDGFEICYRDVDEDGYRSDETVDTTDLGCVADAFALATDPTDCNDHAKKEHDGVTWYPDADEDTYGDDAGGASGCRVEPTDVDRAGDCDDTLPDRNPETVWYADVDGDGFGDPDASLQQCEEPAGYLLVAGDCDDGVGGGDLNPSAEIYVDCDGDDAYDPNPVPSCTWAEGSACEGQPNADYRANLGVAAIDCVDDDKNLQDDAYVDCDDDGFYDRKRNTECKHQECGDGTNALVTFEPPPDFVEDCDDEDETLYPDAPWWIDCDRDGFFQEDTESGCTKPEPPCTEDDGRVYNALDVEAPAEYDCDDHDDAAYPGADQVWADCDGDGERALRDPCEVIELCGPDEPTWTEADGGFVDCNDGEAGQKSGTVWYGDCDGDGYPAVDQTQIQCDDPTGAEVYCADGTFVETWQWQPPGFDCDDQDDDVALEPLWYADCDGDDHADQDNAVSACAYPTDEPACDGGPADGWTHEDETDANYAWDCDDEDIDERPGQEWYPDCDGDGYFASSPVPSCEIPSEDVCGDGSVPDFSNSSDPYGGDCGDDDDPAVVPEPYWRDCDGDGLYAEEPVYGCEAPSCAFLEGEPAESDCDDDDGSDQQTDGKRLYPDCDGDGDYATAGDWVCNPDDAAEWTLCEGSLPTNNSYSDSVPGQDCDDLDPEVSSGSTETPVDGIDQDCDGVDHCWVDGDGDGFGRLSLEGQNASAAGNGMDCETDAKDGQTHITGDCNDANDEVYPGQGCGQLLGNVDVTEFLGNEEAHDLVTLTHAFSGGPTALAILPDLDGDDRDEILVGYAEFPNGNAQGGAYLIYGDVRSELVGAHNLNDHSDVAYVSSSIGDRVGAAVLGTGDLIGSDAKVDFAIAATGEEYDGIHPGVVSVFGGNYVATGWGSRDLRVAGTDDGSEFGFSLATGDVDGDLMADLMVGAPGRNRVYLFLGPLDVHPGIDGTTGALEAAGADLYFWVAGERNGHALATLDFDNDGTDDLAIGDPDNDQARGMVFLRDDIPDLLGTPNQAVDMFATFAPMLQGDTWGHELGASLAAVPDADGDGYDDLLIGAPGAGWVYLALGANAMADIVHGPESLGYLRMEAAGRRLGASLACAGDTNGDGRVEFLIGEEDGSSSAFLVQPDSYVSGQLDLDAGDDVLAQISGETDTRFGSVLAAGGDLDGDGAPDVLIGAPDHADNGAVFGLFGEP